MPTTSDTNLPWYLAAPNDEERSAISDEYYPYETIKFSCHLRITDSMTRATQLTRRQLVRFRERDVAVFFDRIWGDGIHFAGYNAPGLRILEPIRNRRGFTIPLRLSRSHDKGEELEVITQRSVRGAFYDPKGYWEMSMRVPTRLATITVTSPVNLAGAEVSVPRSSDVHAKQFARSLVLRVNRPEIGARHRLTWQWPSHDPAI
jgi:hypothetical protein